MPDENVDDFEYASTYEGEQEEFDLPHLDIETERISLLEFRYRVEQSIIGDYLYSKKRNFCCNFKTENVKTFNLWGVPLLPSANHESTDIVLRKFLKARDWKVHEAFTLLRKVLKWRGDFGSDDIIFEKNLGSKPGNFWIKDGRDKEGRNLCYIVLGEKSEDSLRWRIQCLENGIRKNLSFKPGDVDSIVQIIDLKNSPRLAAKEVKLIWKRMASLLQDYYPGIVYKNLIINVPPWFMAIHALKLRLITKKTKKKFVFVKPSKVTETLLKFASPENILVQYGGLKGENDPEFSTDDKVLELNVKAGTTECIQIPISEAEVTLTWDVTVVGYEVTYKEEFIPEDDCSYNILLQKEKKMEQSIRNSFPIRERGKLLITIVNGSFSNKKVFYRYKKRPSIPLYMLTKLC